MIPCVLTSRLSRNELNLFVKILESSLENRFPYPKKFQTLVLAKKILNNLINLISMNSQTGIQGSEDAKHVTFLSQVVHR